MTELGDLKVRVQELESKLVFEKESFQLIHIHLQEAETALEASQQQVKGLREALVSIYRDAYSPEEIKDTIEAALSASSIPVGAEQAVRSGKARVSHQPETQTVATCSGFDPDAICKCGRRIEEHRKGTLTPEETTHD